MTRYAYYPGCSLETMAATYHVSSMEVAHKLGIELEELEDWNCCGATAYSHVDELLATVLCARNLALAEKQGLDIVAPCNACYKNLWTTNAALKRDPDLAEHMNYALEADDLRYDGNVEVSHIMQRLRDRRGAGVDSPEGRRAHQGAAGGPVLRLPDRAAPAPGVEHRPGRRPDLLRGSA